MGSCGIGALSLRLMLTTPKLKFTHIYIPGIIVIGLGLFIDSLYVAQFTDHGQNITNALVLAVFLWILWKSSKVTRFLMLAGVPIAFVGEVTLSIGLGMYTYRLENVPHYVPLGHAIVYASIYYISKEPWVRQRQQSIIKILYGIMFLYSLLWLIFAQDVFGFLCMVIAMLLFRRFPDTKLFFLMMFFMVVYLELIGTYYGCWVWPPIWFDVFTWIPSANPPSGIGAAYFLFDASCLVAYKIFNLQKWQRLRRFQSRRYAQ
ncbi:MAG: hypothetical protein Q9N67_00960 [Ghiorsea sp.]|nr:hypothetical protein [Ghiorsea sp.]